MRRPVAKQGDQVVATDIHRVGKAYVSLPFVGILRDKLIHSVLIMGRPVAVKGSIAINTTSHPGHNRGVVIAGSAGVKVNGHEIARDGDVAETCNDPKDLPVGRVVASGTVYAGDRGGDVSRQRPQRQRGSLDVVE